MYDDLGIDFGIKAMHFGDGYSLNYYRAYFTKGDDLTQLCECVCGHRTIEQALNCKEVIRKSAWLVANSL